MWQLVFYLSCVVYCAVFGLVIMLCVCPVDRLTGCALVVASVLVVLLCHNLTTADIRMEVWRL